MPTSITSSGITFDDATTLTTGVVPTANIADAAVTPAKLSQPLTLATAAPTTSGVAIDFTPIPSWVKRITVMFNGVSTNGSSALQFQLGTSSGFATSSYSGASTLLTASGVGTSNYTSGMVFGHNGLASYARHGTATIANVSGNVWVGGGIVGLSGVAETGMGGFQVSLSGTLDRIRLTTVNGSDTFDAGSINIIYEG